MVVSNRLIEQENNCKYNINLAIGSIVGHEITHGFDELRRHLDKNGNQHPFWTQSVDDMYEQRSKCIIEQYNNYTVSQINHQVYCFVQYLRKIYANFFR
jgi:predicted metalloendopeptidase